MQSTRPSPGDGIGNGPEVESGDGSGGAGGRTSWHQHLTGTSPNIAGAVETAMAGAVAGAAELGRVSRRIMQRLFDAEPMNNRMANDPAWCLGCSYTLGTKISEASQAAGTPPTEQSETNMAAAASRAPLPSSRTPDTPPGSVLSSLDSSLAYGDSGQDGGWPSEFLSDFESRTWMTYRTGFEVIPRSTDPRATSALSISMRLKTSLGDQGSGFSSDTGWGCMIRSGQSLLANAISINRLGRDWRRCRNPDAERSVIALFADDPRAPYSIHNFVSHGAVACGKYPGEWFGPSATARCIEALTNRREESLRVFTTDLPEVYEDSFMAVAKPEGQEFLPTLLLVGTRLGIDKINHVYEEALISALQLPQSVGIAGGRPASSHYFCGVQGRCLFYLDPHHPRPALPFYENPLDYTPEDLESCHSRRLRQLWVDDVDPSMLIGFLIRDEEDWNAWKSSVKHVQGKAIINVLPNDPARGSAGGRAEAIDEVETLSDDDTEPLWGV